MRQGVPAWTWFLGDPWVEASRPWLRNWNFPSRPVILGIRAAEAGVCWDPGGLHLIGIRPAQFVALPHSKDGAGGVWGGLWGDLGPLGKHSSFQSFIIFSITLSSLQGGKSQLAAEDAFNVLLFTLPQPRRQGSGHPPFYISLSRLALLADGAIGMSP